MQDFSFSHFWPFVIYHVAFVILAIEEQSQTLLSSLTCPFLFSSVVSMLLHKMINGFPT